MDQKTFFKQLEKHIHNIDSLQQKINSEIILVKGLVIEYEFAHRKEINEDARDVFPSSTPYFGVAPVEE